MTSFLHAYFTRLHCVPDVPSLYQLLQQQFGLGVNDVKHGFTEAELAAVMAAFDTHPEAGK
ncbi:putative arylamine N-acetyltransferase [Salmonella enterica subsp. enterica serovar Choleraesuis str. 0006]|nr:putative arylamine N-acetyltransferase [Salmonella enterica subsp. enterica serovar Choleraesuis str. 0006]